MKEFVYKYSIYTLIVLFCIVVEIVLYREKLFEEYGIKFIAIVVVAIVFLHHYSKNKSV